MQQAITYENWQDISASFTTDDHSKGALSVLEWAYHAYNEDEIVYASSFGAEAIVLIDLITQIKREAKLVFLDTDLHFPETYQVIEDIKKRFPALQVEMKKPHLTLDEQAARYESALWKKDPNQCCQIRKILPLQEAMVGKKAWISGLRREQSPTRKYTNFVNKDEKFTNIKICPLIHWRTKDVWDYIKEKQLPYNALHDVNYPSIGCFPCTQPTNEDADSRAGRWQGLTKTECGLHTNS
ncbi:MULTISPECIES: phosphoadenylyl-sulfate reductase [Cytobacillus]|uniref:Adenosine 5'-phosphosulfate reductase n=1 Tax=Cytobacillus kochii TaxID=859143 RepID=A0A248TNN4_9BACI|nr:phosphoadenylyl-sulfate reductase [Cytobacillus kochii]ASV69729.1 phosphoadenosine phosphosulfate reductase [Cytobacillus kochii]